MNHLIEGWPLGPTSTVHMDGTSVYRVRAHGEPGILASVAIGQGEAETIRKVVQDRVIEMRNGTVADVLCALNLELKVSHSDSVSEAERASIIAATLERIISLFADQRRKELLAK